MKNFILLLSAILISVNFSFSQSPQAFKYQAVARDAAGEILPGQTVSFRIGIRDSTAIGTILYQETHIVVTNQFGLATFEIGSGTLPSGIFSEIDWSNGLKFLEIELDPNGGTTYDLLGTSQLLSVPYALYAENAGQTDDGDWTVDADTLYSAADSAVTIKDGKVGIGTRSPVTELHVSGKGAFGNSISSYRANRALNLISTDAVMRIWRVTDNTSFSPGVELVWGVQPSQDDDGNYWWDFYLDGLSGSFKIRDRSFGQGNQTRLAIDTSGNIGIGTMYPDEKLHVAGALKIENMAIGSQTDSFVTWDPADSTFKAISISSLGGDNDWTIDADTLYSGADSTVTIKDGRVGIGTTSPTATAHIKDILRLEPRDTFPPSPEEGDIFIHSVDNNIYCYLNGIWQQLNN